METPASRNFRHVAFRKLRGTRTLKAKAVYWHSKSIRVMRRDFPDFFFLRIVFLAHVYQGNTSGQRYHKHGITNVQTIRLPVNMPPVAIKMQESGSIKQNQKNHCKKISAAL